MTTQRRLIEDAQPGSIARALLSAGEVAEPPASSKQKLLVLLLSGTAAHSATGGAAAASVGKSGFFGVASTASVKIAALGVVGALATGAGYMLVSRTQAPRETEQPTQQPLAPNQSPEPSQPTEGPTESTADVATDASASTPKKMLVRLPEPQADRPSRPRASPAPALEGTPPAPEATTSSPPTPELEQPETEPTDTRLAEELRYLDAARNALGAGDTSSARNKLDAYYRRFPHGYLGPEAQRLSQRVGRMESP